MALASCSLLETSSGAIQDRIVVLEGQLEDAKQSGTVSDALLEEMQLEINALKAALAATEGETDWESLLNRLIMSGIDIAAAVGIINLQRGTPNNRRGAAPKPE